MSVNRLHKLLESSNIKLASIATGVMGVSGRLMLEAFLGGEADPAVLSESARGEVGQETPSSSEGLGFKVAVESLTKAA